MAVTLQGTPSVYENASATSVVLPYPTGVQAGELLVAHITHTHQTAPTTNPGGWTLVDSENSISGGPPSTAIWMKWADGTEAGTVTFATTTTAGRVTGIMERWAGVHTTTPLDVTPTGSSTNAVTSYTPPTITPATNNAKVIYNISAYVASTDPSDPSGVTRIAASGTTGRKLIIATDSGTITAGTPTTAKTWTHGSAIMFTGITMALRPASDTGEPPPPPPPPPPSGGDGGPTGPQPGTSPTLNHRVVGIHENPSTNARVQSKTTNAVQVRLKCSTDSAGTTGVVFGPYATPDSRGNARMTISGLQPSTRYYYRVMMKNVEGGEFADTASLIGRLKTAPNGPSSFSFCGASCNSGYGTATLNAAANRGDDMFLHLGDLYYADGSGTGIDNFRSKMTQALTTAQNLWATTNMMYVPSDHDGMNNNGAAGSDPTAWQNWNIARSELMPNPNSYMTWTWGPRVRFIMLDTRSFKSSPSATDNSSKTALGATQKQWFKDTINAAAEPLIIIGQDSSWVCGTEAGEDAWEGYKTEQNELAAFMNTKTNKRFVVIGGDMHAVTYHTGGSGSPGGATVFMMAPIKNTASHKGGPWTITPIPAAGTSNVEQYGRVTVTDTGGTTIDVNYQAFTAGGTQRINYTKTFTVEPYLGPSGTQVKAHRAEISAAQPSPVNVRAQRASISVPVGTAAVRIHRAEMTVVGSADPGVNVRNLSPGLTVEMTAVAPGTPVNYTWDQVAGPTVTRTVSTDTTKCTYITPALKADSDLVFRVVANYADGTKSGEGITRHSVVRTAHLSADADGSTSTVTFRPIEVGVPTGGGEEEPPPGGGETPPPPPPPPGYLPVGGPTGATWQIKLSEDFNELNRQLWTPFLNTEGGINNTSGTFSRNVAVENGELTLKLESSTAGAAISTNPRDGVAGHVGFEFTTGYLEARIFFPGGATLPNWPVFMTQGQAPQPANGENDIFEVAGWPGDHHTVTTTYHYEEAGPKATGIYVPGTWGGNYHTYALHRRVDGVNDYYYDGTLVHSHLRRETAPHFIAIINEATTNTNQLYGDTSKVRVDYVRVWEQTNTPPPDTTPDVEDPTARYVSSSGSDTNPGTLAAPWKTLAKVRTELMAGTIGRGNKVLLKRGDTFFGPEFNCPVVSGTSGVVAFDAYGSGAKPRVAGYKISNNSWVLHSTNIWKLNITANSGQYTGNTGATETNVGFLRVNGEIKGWKKWSLAAVQSDWDFYNDGTYVYVKLGQSPGAGVEIVPRQNAWRPSSNTTVKNIHLDGHGAHGFGLYSVQNCTISDCLIENIGGSALNADTRYGNGIEIWIGCGNITIQNNVIRQTYDVAITQQGTIEGSNKAWTNIMIRLNRIENCNQSLELWARGTAAAGTGYINCKFVDNVCVDAGFSWAALIRSDSIGRGTHILTYDMQLPIDYEIARNVFLRARHNYAYCTWNNVFPAGINTHDNQITLASGQKILYQGPETINQWQTYVSRTGEEIGTQWFISGTEPAPGDGTAATAYNWGPVVRGDEFNYLGAPDSTKWSVYNSPGHAGNGVRSPAAWNGNGTVMRVSGDSNGTTGGMSGKFDRGISPYYRVEVRMRTSIRHPEYHPVCLLWPDDAGSVISGVPEIDYAEGTGDVTKMKFFLHYGTSSQTYAERVIDTTQWHNYAMEWSPNAVIGYIDGVEWFRDSDPAHIPTIPMHVALQLDWFPGDSPDTNPPPCWVEYEWIREYNL